MFPVNFKRKPRADPSKQPPAGRVLILDEVDALVIDEEPNEPFLGEEMFLFDWPAKTFAPRLRAKGLYLDAQPAW